jgi:hypothetical protein
MTGQSKPGSSGSPQTLKCDQNDSLPGDKSVIIWLRIPLVRKWLKEDEIDSQSRDRNKSPFAAGHYSNPSTYYIIT